VPVDPTLYRRHRFPAEIISHATWLYFRFNLSHRDVEELLAERGVQVSYEAIRLWCRKFGRAYAEQLRRRRPGPADKWHVDEMQLKISANGTASRLSIQTGRGNTQADVAVA
jgi:putative transposase